jgi:hypothetical protein
MNDDRLWSAAELEALTPNERDTVTRAGFVVAPSEAHESLVARVRRQADLRIADLERQISH